MFTRTFLILAPCAAVLLHGSFASAATTYKRPRPRRVSPALTVRKATPIPEYPESVVYHPSDILPPSSPATPLKGQLQARRLGSAPDLPGVSAAPGDYLLQNEIITVIISDANHPSGNAASGGYIVAALLNSRPNNQLAQLHLYLKDRYPRMAQFTTITVLNDGCGSQPAAIEARGLDTNDPAIEIASVYSLAHNSSQVAIETVIQPKAATVKDYAVGDAFAWGPTQQFLPERGFISSGGRVQVPWIGGAGKGVAYGLYTPGSQLWGPIGSTWADLSGTTVTATASSPARYLRYFVVSPDLAGICKIATESTSTPLYRVSGIIKEEETGAKADGVRVLASRDAKPLTQAVSSDGAFSFDLPAGKYLLTLSDTVRTPVSPPMVVDLPAPDNAPLQMQVASPAVVHALVTESGTGAPMPCKLTFLGRENTPDPDLGITSERRARNTVDLMRGEELIALPAGSYDIVFSRGIEYDITTRTLNLGRNRQVTLAVTLNHSVDPKGYVSADFHQHMKNSFDSAIPLEDRVISGVCEGLDIIVTTDHNFVTDLSPVIQKLQLGRWIRSVVGDEMTPRKHFFGHINGFPLVPDPAKQFNGAVQFESTTAANVMAEIASRPGKHVIQVNHPRSDDVGYFNYVRLNPTDGTTTHPNWCDRFTALEVLNGKRLDEFEDSLKDWFNLLNMGYTFAATGNSDSHKIYDQEPGYPRNYIAVAQPVRDEDLVDAVNRRRALFVTNGPIVDFRTKIGTRIGTMQSVPAGPIQFQAKVEGANFVQPSSLEFYGNGKLLKTVHFTETSAPLKWQGELTDTPTSDTWYSIVVRGTHSLYPVINPLQSSRGPIQVTPIAFTNPIWIDRDNDSKFTAINARLLPMMHQDRSAKALQQLDQLTSDSQRRGQFKRPGKKNAWSVEGSGT